MIVNRNMKVSNYNNQTNFNGTLINKKQILKLGKDNVLTPIEASFVELNPNVEEDLEALRRTANSWKTAEYAKSIYISAFSLKRGYFCNDILKFYALTEQVKNYENMRPNKILGVMEVVNDSDCAAVNYIQVKPPKNDIKQYKHVGKTMLSSVRHQFENYPIVLNAVESAVGFYKKIGFKLTCKKPIQFTLPAGKDVK